MHLILVICEIKTVPKLEDHVKILEDMYLENVFTSSMAHNDAYMPICEGKSCDIHKNNYTRFDILFKPNKDANQADIRLTIENILEKPTLSYDIPEMIAHRGIFDTNNTNVIDSKTMKKNLTLNDTFLLKYRIFVGLLTPSMKLNLTIHIEDHDTQKPYACG
ncbi:unnamed protein product, partial [Oppiella nova]